MTEHKLATQAMVLALLKRIVRLEAALEKAGIEIPDDDSNDPDPKQKRIDDYQEG